MSNDLTREGYEVGYDAAGDVEIIRGEPRAEVSSEVEQTALSGGCTAGAATME